MKRAEIIRDTILLGIVSSIIATLLVWGFTQLFDVIEPFSLEMYLMISVCVLLFISIIVFFRLTTLRIPGLISADINRRNTDYFMGLVRKAEYSVDYLGATGSSSFVQGGQLMNILSEKYENNSSFSMRVMLIDPQAEKLIQYRKAKLGQEPNVLSSEDILSTIRVLSEARENYVKHATQKLEVAVYDQELVWHIVIIDKKYAALGFYGPKKSGWKFPVAYFEKKNNSFYFAIEEQFNQRWHNSRTVQNLK